MEKYKVIQTHELDLEKLKQVCHLDKLVYTEAMAGNIDSDSLRFKKVPESFLLLQENEKIIAYLCFFSVTDKFFEGMIESDKLYDNNIVPKDMLNFTKNHKHHIFIISMVIDPEYKALGLYKKVTKAFKDRIKKYNDDFFYISDISGYAVSGAGEHILKSFGCEIVKEIYDEEEGAAKLYIGSYQDFLREYNKK